MRIAGASLAEELVLVLLVVGLGRGARSAAPVITYVQITPLNLRTRDWATSLISTLPRAAVDGRRVVAPRPKTKLHGHDAAVMASMSEWSIPIVTEYPHDDTAFTQGLVYDGAGSFFESTGLRGESSVRLVNSSTGEVLAKRDLDRTYFGEGLALWNGTLFQLTWQSRVGFIYSADASLSLLGTFNYATEGWGLTLLAGTETQPTGCDFLLLSDGSANIFFFDAVTLEERSDLRLTVRDAGVEVIRLNELEVVNGQLWANIWLTDRIAVIDLWSGEVVTWLDCSQTVNRIQVLDNSADVLNGIAHDPVTGRLWITGKLWPKVLEVDLGLLQAENELLAAPRGASSSLQSPTQAPSTAGPTAVPTVASFAVPTTRTPTKDSGTLIPSTAPTTWATYSPTVTQRSSTTANPTPMPGETGEDGNGPLPHAPSVPNDTLCTTPAGGSSVQSIVNSTCASTAAHGTCWWLAVCLYGMLMILRAEH